MSQCHADNYCGGCAICFVESAGAFVFMTDQDIQFFQTYPDRRARIRLPGKVAHRDAQRSVRYLDEEEMGFRALGSHDPKRRRIIAYRLPADHPTHSNHILKIPMLAFSDESIEDTDAVLVPIVAELMTQAAMK
jgi:hypothetical protein